MKGWMIQKISLANSNSLVNNKKYIKNSEVQVERVGDILTVKLPVTTMAVSISIIAVEL